MEKVCASWKLRRERRGKVVFCGIMNRRSNSEACLDFNFTELASSSGPNIAKEKSFRGG